MNNFATRTVSATVFTIVMLACLLVNKFLFAALFIFFMVTMMIEFYRMTIGDGFKLQRALSIATGIILFVLMFSVCAFGLPARFVSFAIVPLLAVMTSTLYSDNKEPGSATSLLAGFLYIAIPVSLVSLTVFRNGDFDAMLLLCFFVIIWGTDVGAFLLGSALGKKLDKKLCPAISPKKTWIGFWGGMALAVMAALALKWAGLLELPALHCIVLAVLMNIAGVFGDLFESKWKRMSGVKDSGKIIPGHGGVLDRMDSALFAIPVGAAYLALANLL